MPDALEILKAWDSFYVIIGSSAAALTGLMFVVVTLMPEVRRRSGTTDKAIAAFATPTIVDFCAALLVSAILSAPWTDLWQAGLAVGASGVLGLIYSAIVARRVHQTTEYKPEAVDWLWYVVLPTVAYIALVVGGFVLRNDATGTMYAIGAATLGLLFIGIHNAWDSVTYITFGLVPPEPKPEPKQEHKHHK